MTGGKTIPAIVYGHAWMVAYADSQQAPVITSYTGSKGYLISMEGPWEVNK